MASDDIWYYTRRGERIGPVTELELSNIVARGDLRPEELVWKEGMEQWVQLRFAEGLPEPLPAESDASSAAPAQSFTGSHSTVPVAPVAALPVYSTPVQPIASYANFGQRFLASLIDNVILFVPRVGCFFGTAVTGAVMDEVSGPNDARDNALILVTVGIWVLMGWIYHAVLEASRWQGTLGKRALSLRVADITGQRASFIQTSVRHFLKLFSALIFGIGYLMAAFTERRQALHDMAANTLVLHVPQEIAPMHYAQAPVSARL